MQFNEDDGRIIKDNALQNFAVIVFDTLRGLHIAVNLLSQEKSAKLGTKNKQFRAAMDDEYLSKVLGILND